MGHPIGKWISCLNNMRLFFFSFFVPFGFFCSAVEDASARALCTCWCARECVCVRVCEGVCVCLWRCARARVCEGVFVWVRVTVRGCVYMGAPPRARLCVTVDLNLYLHVYQGIAFYHMMSLVSRAILLSRMSISHRGWFNMALHHFNWSETLGAWVVNNTEFHFEIGKFRFVYFVMW